MPRHFSKMMQSPYFRTDHFMNESAGTKSERDIERILYSIKNKIMFWRGRK
jgi:hypothetical protein